jgi:hypothetical protein
MALSSTCAASREHLHQTNRQRNKTNITRNTTKPTAQAEPPHKQHRQHHHAMLQPPTCIHVLLLCTELFQARAQAQALASKQTAKAAPLRTCMHVLLLGPDPIRLISASIHTLPSLHNSSLKVLLYRQYKHSQQAKNCQLGRTGCQVTRISTAA